jgi:alginate production protein
VPTAAGSLLRLPGLQMVQFQMPAQFQLPGGVREGTPQTREETPIRFPAELKFGYAYGSDSELTYRRDADLDKGRRDNFALFAPTLFGFVDYRPNSWLEMRLETTLEVPIPLERESRVILPTGEIIPKEKFRTSILIDQAYATIKNLGPFELTLGRRNFEDPRLWLYDAALDALIVKHRAGLAQTELSVSRENRVDGDLLINVPKGRINNYIWYTEYRGFEDHRLAGYWIKRQDRTGAEGRPLLLGVRAFGRPSDLWNYWADLGFARGTDELRRKLSGRGFDVGGTYRFAGVPLLPSITLGYAYGSGDRDPNDNRNTEFRQSGLQSNETRFAGLTQFKRYGETLDPELGNVRIFTAGIGLRLAPTVFVDLVHHRYRLNAIADQIRNWALTAQMNQDDTALSRDVGDETDIIVGIRNLFGIRRLGVEVRAGVFRPGKAFRNDTMIDPDTPVFRPADKSVSVLAVIIY